MNRTMFVALLASGALAMGSRGQCALVSSSKTFSQQVTNGFFIQSTAYNPSNTPIYQRPFVPEGKLSGGVASASITVDTDANTGVFNSLQLTPFTLTPSTVSAAFSASITIVLVPADFPDPAVIQNISGQWRENVTISGVTGASPSFATSSPDFLDPFLTVPPWFEMSSNVAFSTPSFTLTGTYHVIGPLSTTSVPFSVTFQAEPQQANSSIGIKGNPGFGPGFDFIPRETGVVYRAVNPQIFEGTVDGMRFSANLYDQGAAVTFARNNLVAEPASIAMGSAGVLPVIALTRRRMRGREAPSAI